MNFFGNEQISIEDIQSFKEAAPDILFWAAPAMFTFVLIEFITSYVNNKHYYSGKETLGSVLVGIGNVVIGLLLKTFLFLIFVFIYNILPWRMSLNWWTLIPCYVIFDFCSYWTHNLSHRIRFFWATHVVHHSSTHFNLSVSFRLSWMQYIKIIFIFPVALLGFHPVVIFMTSQIAVLFQFWVHTEYIRKLHPAIEYILVTPSNHRVHHGSQPKYINKNYGATFVIWDRIFNTYQAEEEKVEYGLTEDITDKANPIHINFHEYGNIVKDMTSTASWKRKWFYVFGDPGRIAALKQKS